MNVNIYENGRIIMQRVSLREIFGDDTESYSEAFDALRILPSMWIGGGAAPEFYVTRCD